MMTTIKNKIQIKTISDNVLNGSSLKKLRLLELYSGIGGMRFALEGTGILYEVVAAIDMNPVVNDIYQHNFGKNNHYQRNLCSLTASELEDMQIDVLTMSPPCQPFTRVGLKKDVEDARSNSFLHVLNILAVVERKPTFIILENVQGFELSQAKDVLVQTLERCSYAYREFLLSPQDFGIPNSRLRYYLIARLKHGFCESEKKIWKEIPNQDKEKFPCAYCSEDVCAPQRVCPLKHFLEREEDFSSYLVPDRVLSKYWTVFDIVDENSQTCCCFTKAYSHYAQGTGSIFVPIQDSLKVADIFKAVSNNEDSKIQLELLKQLKLRYFTPKEIANIMCFPKTFDFPPHTTLKQKYRSLGNSLNVFVVSCLMKYLIQGEALNEM